MLPDVLIATHRLSFSILLSENLNPGWINFYAPPEPEIGRIRKPPAAELTEFQGRVFMSAIASSEEYVVGCRVGA